MSFSAMGGHREKVVISNQEADPHQILNLRPLDLGFPSLQNCGK